jgi:pyrroline-5-carboxylate reductase
MKMKSEITSRKSPTKIVFIGAGNMAEAMARGILASNIYRPGDMLAADIDKSRLAFFRRKLGIKGLADNKKAAATAEIIVLAVKPQQAPQVLDDLRGNLQGNPLLISIVTGFSVKKIADALAMPPRIIRVVPNTPALAGTGASAYCRGRAATARDEKLAARILNSIGVAVRLDEPLMNAATALSGSGPAYTL